MPGLSDVDTVGLATIPEGGRAALAVDGWRAGAAARATALRAAFPHVADLDMALVAVERSSDLGRWLEGAADAPPLDERGVTDVDGFRLASQGLLLHGADVVSRLPRAALRVKPRLIVRLHADVSRARTAIEASAARGAARGEAALRIARWAAKRALRAGMELVAVAYGGFSRDLLPCHEAISAQLGAETGAASLAVLQWACATSRGGAAGHAQAARALEATEALAHRLECAYLREHFAPLDDVTKLALAPPLRAAEECASRPPSPLQELAQGWRLGPPVSDSLRPMTVAYGGQVRRLAWGEAEGGAREALEAEAARAIALGEEPIVLSGAARALAHKLGSSRWNLEALQWLVPHGNVRVSPGPTFAFCKESHPLITAGLYPPPSRTTRMSGAELAARLAPGWPGALPPLYYGEGERYYLQADVPTALLANLTPPTFWRAPSGSEAQPQRLWVSGAGACTPMHFDLAASYLAQARGRKRILFFPPHATAGLYPYPIDHPLHRRARVGLYDEPGFRAARFPRFAEVEGMAREAVLEEGDVVFFPARWYHHVESLTLSFSIGGRYV